MSCLRPNTASDMPGLTCLPPPRLAGSDTTGTTVTYGLYELAKNLPVQAKLRDALRAEIPNPADVTLERLEAVPYLDWTVKEMLRTHPTLPSLLERVVPDEGARVAGYYVPGGSVIGMSAWSMNKSPDVFADPLAFLPERFVWLDTPSPSRRSQHD